MWYSPAVTVTAASEPLTLEEVKLQCRIETSADEALVTRLITAARAHVEAYCGTKLVSQTVAAKCDGFADFYRVPFGPVQSVSLIEYIDAAGAQQTLDDSVYEARTDGFYASIVLKFGKSWPSIQPNSRITVTAVVGYDTIPPSVVQAMMLLIGAWYENREETVIGVSIGRLPESVSVDALLCNDRLNV